MHEVTHLWVRPEKRGALVPRDALELVADEGIVGDHTRGRRRHVTIVFADDWAAAVADHGRDVDPVERRANVVVTGGRGPRYLERRMRLGGAEIEILGIVAPCERMDQASEGLKDALMPDGRGGIWGVVISGGAVRPGDRLEVAE